MDPVVERLVVGISPDNPAGENLEDTQLLASFDGYRVFGQMVPPGVDTDWREIRDKALEGLDQSRDLRLLAHLGAAALRTQGVAGFCDVLGVASRWFDGFPDKLYPLVDEDAILRRNALNCSPTGWQSSRRCDASRSSPTRNSARSHSGTSKSRAARRPRQSPTGSRRAQPM